MYCAVRNGEAVAGVGPAYQRLSSAPQYPGAECEQHEQRSSKGRNKAEAMTAPIAHADLKSETEMIKWTRLSVAGTRQKNGGGALIWVLPT